MPRKPLSRHPEYAAIYRSVLESPDDDLPQLVLCDWLEEHGEEVKAKALRRAVLNKDVAQTRLKYPGIAIVRRGFIENVTRAPISLLVRQKELFEQHPITSVYFDQMEPIDPSGTGRHWTWITKGGRERSAEDWWATLPEIIWYALEDANMYVPQIDKVKVYATREAADDALSRAVVKVWRKAAGLPPLTRPPTTTT